MGQQQGSLAGSAGGAEWDAKSAKSACSLSSSKRFRRKVRKSLRIRNSRSCRDLSATFQYHSPQHSVCDQLNLNTASEDELMTLSGITRQTARNIVAHRSAIGGFRKVEDLALVSNVGANRMELLRHDVCVSSSGRGIRVDRGCATLSLESLSGTSNRMNVCAPVNVNTASMFELMAVPGLTQEVAAGICHIREKKGRFKSVDSLLKVKGMSTVRLALLRPKLCVDNRSLETLNGENGSVETSDSVILTAGDDTRPSTSADVRASPSISLNSRRSRRTISASTGPKGWDPEVDYDIYKLIAHLAVRPVVARSDPPSISQNRIRIALWDLEQLNEEKATNLGVQEVICRTLLENEISVLVCHGVTSLSVGECLTAELNQPLLSRVAAWEPQERRWHHIFPSHGQPSARDGIDKRQNGDASPIENGGSSARGREQNGVSDVRNANGIVSPESHSGLLYAATNGLRHLDYKLIQLRPDLAPALITLFEVGGSLQFAVISVDLRGLDATTELKAMLPVLVERLAAELIQTDNIVVCGNLLTSPTDEALDELTRVGFHLLHPIVSRDHPLHEHLQVWCSSGARALCCNSEAETVRKGLTHPMIPRGAWHWGGAVSTHKPVFIELSLPTANGAILAHGQQVLLNGMVSAD
ncbi:endonuclease/exonuclease/phosphatase family domain-containing protein 1-like [Tropilaelaps mercedesae]|uniref:Endonuclease/exonuclease/phosphatase family domain-containing protein 1-like n=1 Tax=Tropilaelaps mercedesae TaxID=418985 RepID=A0A1V9X5Z9_9ACAR|nr:endonuclease/exonuclease/phosphatase family domain-containing protein 1-like [Tropilaelaps mercedesae]